MILLANWLWSLVGLIELHHDLHITPRCWTTTIFLQQNTSIPEIAPLITQQREWWMKTHLEHARWLANWLGGWLAGSLSCWLARWLVCLQAPAGWLALVGCQYFLCHRRYIWIFFMYIYIYIFLFECVYIYIYIYIYIFLFECVYIYIYIYIKFKCLRRHYCHHQSPRPHSSFHPWWCCISRWS